MWKKIGEILCWMNAHSIGDYDGYDGCNAYATCRRCGKKGMIDSQGNLF